MNVKAKWRMNANTILINHLSFVFRYERTLQQDTRNVLFAFFLLCIYFRVDPGEFYPDPTLEKKKNWLLIRIRPSKKPDPDPT